MHVALRGVSTDGSALRLSRDYVKRGVREIAEELCTWQLGFRTTLDAAEAERREISETRLTSLDRVILRHARASENGFVFTRTAEKEGEQSHHVLSRLIALSRMGLAESLGDGSWLLRSDMEQVLRAMQRSGDRQKTLFTHGELVSDKRLPLEVMDWRQLSSIEGRVLVHGEEEHSGKSFLMLEATSARVCYVPYTHDMEDIRNRGGMKRNSFIRLTRRTADGRLRVRIEEFGHAEAVLTNRQMLRKQVEDMRERGLHPTEDGWGGWLGRYQKALCKIESDRFLVSRDKRINKDSRRRSSSLER